MIGWSISRQVRTLAGTLLIGLGLTAAVSIFSNLSLGSTFDRYSGAGQHTTLTSQVSQRMLEGRALASSWRKTNNPDQYTAAANELRGVGVAANRLSESLGEGSSSQAVLGEIRSMTEDYLGHLDGARVARRTLDTELAESAQIAGEASVALVELIRLTSAEFLPTNLLLAAKAQESLLLGRLYMEGFVATESDEAKENARTNLASALEGLRQAEGAIRDEAAKAIATQALTHTEALAARFEELVATKAIMVGHFEAMDRIEPEIVSRVDQINASIRAEMSVIGEAADQRAGIVLLLIVGMTAIVMAGGGFFAVKTTTQISEQIDTSVDVMEQLAGGDLTVAIEGTERETEIGKIARALVVFRDAGLDAKKRAEAEAQAERERAEAQKVAAKRQAEAEEAARQKLEAERKRTIQELSASIGGVVDAAARGDFDVRIEAVFEEPELAKMAESINALVGNVAEGVGETARTLKEMAAGRFNTSMEGRFSGAFAELQANVNETISALSELVVDIMAASSGVAEQSTKMTDISDNLAKRAEHQAASLEETSAAMREIAENAKMGAQSAGDARSRADQTVDQVDEAGRVVNNAIAAMQDIKTASTEIEEIVSVIEGIAFQTNLLALNASVEAARAGSAGKGFAVVATEVRDLAQRSADASHNIKALIEKSSAKIETGVNLVESTGGTLSQVVEMVREMSGSMGGIAATSHEQASAVAEIQSAISTLDDLTQKNAHVADQTREEAKVLNEASESMRHKISQFQTNREDAAA